MKQLVDPLLKITLTSAMFFNCVGSYARDGYLDILDASYIPNEKTYIGITNMPRLINQGAAGICYAATAAVLIDESYCSRKNIEDCKNLPDKKRASVLDITRFSMDLRDKKTKQGDKIDISDKFNYEGLYFGANGAFVSQLLTNTGSVTHEACAPLSQTLSQNPDAYLAQKEEFAMWDDFKNTYLKYKKTGKDAASYASQEAERLKAQYPLKAPVDQIIEGFSLDTYEKFLDKLLIPEDCWDIKHQVKIPFDMDYYPKRDLDNKKIKINYQSAINKIKEILISKHPIGVGYCSQNPLKAKTMSECGSLSHSAVIHGYRQSCNRKNQCVEELQIQNSWGEEWQRSHNNGWVVAKKFIDRTYYQPQMLFWFHEPPQRYRW